MGWIGVTGTCRSDVWNGGNEDLKCVLGSDDEGPWMFSWEAWTNKHCLTGKLGLSEGECSGRYGVWKTISYEK